MNKMRSDSILILGSNENKELTEPLFELGLTAIVRESMQQALEKLRSGIFGAIIVDRQHAECDVLELVLNVRDLDEDIPIFVLGRFPGTEDDKLALADRKTFVMDGIKEIQVEIGKAATAGDRRRGAKGSGK